jgi:hypothetical protein
MTRLSLLILPAVCLGLAGCANRGGVTDADLAPAAGQVRPMPRPGGASMPGAGAVTAEQFDTTTEAERAAALAGPVGGEARVGRTVATLGNPADPGFWLETPLVSTARPGRVVAVATGESVQVELRPIEGDPGAGSRISLPALRLLGVGLTGLHELDVFAG